MAKFEAAVRTDRAGVETMRVRAGRRYRLTMRDEGRPYVQEGLLTQVAWNPRTDEVSVYLLLSGYEDRNLVVGFPEQSIESFEELDLDGIPLEPVESRGPLVLDWHEDLDR